MKKKTFKDALRKAGSVLRETEKEKTMVVILFSFCPHFAVVFFLFAQMNTNVGLRVIFRRWMCSIEKQSSHATVSKPFTDFLF